MNSDASVCCTTSISNCACQRVSSKECVSIIYIVDELATRWENAASQSPSAVLGTTSRSMTGIYFVLPSTVICCALYLFRRICNRIDTRVIETHTTPDQGHVSWQTNRSVSLRIVNTQLYILMLRHTNAVFLKTFFAQKSLMKSTLRHHHAGYI